MFQNASAGLAAAGPFENGLIQFLKPNQEPGFKAWGVNWDIH